MQKQKQSGRKKSKGLKAELIMELTDMLKDIDEEGLLFLIEQANILIYNRRVENINRKLAGSRGKRKKEPPAAYAVDIEESEDGRYFYIIIKNFRIFFTLEEMKNLVKICHASQDERDAAERLYNWFNRNRKDLLIDASIGTRTDPHLVGMYKKIIHTYRPKSDA
jgi:hypothetical protein